jgi:hypothetical protein
MGVLEIGDGRWEMGESEERQSGNKKANELKSSNPSLPVFSSAAVTLTAFSLQPKSL